MNKIKYSLFLFGFLFIKIAFAQDFRLAGILISQEDNSPLPGATLKLISLPDSSKVDYRRSGSKGEFMFDKLTRGRFRLEVSYIGFQNYSKEVFAGGKSENIGSILLVPAATNIAGIEITGTTERAEQKGDTAQYNAAAFKVSQDATTEDLVKKMPGITIENGTVKAQGEDVKRVLVDGKQFFGDDPSVTLKNLPAEVVDKIQVFDKLSDQAAWTGFDDGSGQKTINIVTRNNKNTGQFGKFSAGYGTDARYLLGANINFFKGKRRITLLGMSNNVNQQNFSADDIIGSGGGGRQTGGRGGSFMPVQMGAQNGIFSTNAIGVNYTDDWSNKISFNGSYFYNSGINNTNQQLSRQYILGGEVNQYYNELNSSETNNTNHRLNMRIEYNIDSSNSIILTPRFSAQINNSTSYSGALTSLYPDFAPADILNESVNKNNGDGNGYNFSNDFLYRHKFNKKGRTVSIDLGTGVNNKYQTNYLNSLTGFYEPSHSQINDTLNQYGKTISDGVNLSSNLVYTEPVGEKSQLQLNYNISWSPNNNDKKTYNYSEVQQQYTDFDTLYSNIYNSDYLTHRIGTGYLYRTSKLNLNASLTYQYAILKGNTSFPVVDSTRKTFNSVLPNVMVNYKFSTLANLRIVYRASTNAPSTTQLQRVVKNSNPLLLTTGNPDLKQEIRHFAMSRFSLSNKDKTSNLFAMLFFQKTFNYIGSSTIIAGNDSMVNGQKIGKGTQLSMPINLDGAWNGRALITIGFPVKKIKSNHYQPTKIKYLLI